MRARVGGLSGSMPRPTCSVALFRIRIRNAGGIHALHSLLSNSNIRKSLYFSFIAALCWVIAGGAMGLGIERFARIRFAWAVFNLLICFALSILNLLPAITARLIRLAVAEEPFEGAGAVFASFIHFATLRLLIWIPYNILTGAYPMNSPVMILALVGYVAWAVVSYVAAYFILTMPPLIISNATDEMYIPLSDSDKCLAALGDFITVMASSLGERRKMDKLWAPVSNYLKDDGKIRKLVLNKGLRHDEIALNAVGSVAFKILAEGELHAAFGTLSSDGEYVRKIWWVTANELVKRSYYRPEDVTQGIQSLDAAIVSVGPK